MGTPQFKPRHSPAKLEEMLQLMQVEFAEVESAMYAAWSKHTGDSPERRRIQEGVAYIKQEIARTICDRYLPFEK